MPKSRVKLLVAALVAAVALGTGYGLWEWGRGKNYWGTPDDVAALWELSFVHAAEGLPGGLSDRAQRPHGGFMSKPAPAYIEFTVSGESDVRPGASLKKLAEDHGWTIEENCARNIHWCAQMRDAQGLQLFMTVADAPVRMVEGSTMLGPYVRVKIFYL